MLKYLVGFACIALLAGCNSSNCSSDGFSKRKLSSGNGGLDSTCTNSATAAATAETHTDSTSASISQIQLKSAGSNLAYLSYLSNDTGVVHILDSTASFSDIDLFSLMPATVIDQYIIDANANGDFGLVYTTATPSGTQAVRKFTNSAVEGPTLLDGIGASLCAIDNPETYENSGSGNTVSLAMNNSGQLALENSCILKVDNTSDLTPTPFGLNVGLTDYLSDGTWVGISDSAGLSLVTSGGVQSSHTLTSYAGRPYALLVTANDSIIITGNRQVSAVDTTSTGIQYVAAYSSTGDVLLEPTNVTASDSGAGSVMVDNATGASVPLNGTSLASGIRSFFFQQPTFGSYVPALWYVDISADGIVDDVATYVTNVNDSYPSSAVGTKLMAVPYGTNSLLAWTTDDSNNSVSTVTVNQ